MLLQCGFFIFNRRLALCRVALILAHLAHKQLLQILFTLAQGQK